MGCCGNNDDDILLVEPKRRRSRCCQGVLCSLAILGIVAGVTVLVLFVFNPKSDSDDYCSMKFHHLKDFEENYGSFISSYFIDRCNEERPKVGKYRPPKPSNLSPPPAADPTVCSSMPDNHKFDCFPRGNVSKGECQKRGCCFHVATDPDIPSCFYPGNFSAYRLVKVQEDDFGILAVYNATFSSPYPNDALNISLRVKFLSPTEIAIMIRRGDVGETRFDPLIPKVSTPDAPVDSKERQYIVETNKSLFGFKVIRKSNNATIFETAGSLIVSGQVLQISVMTVPVLFGIGERRGPIRLDMTTWSSITLFNHDSSPITGQNGYGTLPFYLGIEEGGLSHGVTFLNYYGMDIEVVPAPALTYRTIGGSIGFLITLGKNPVNVIAKNSALVSPRPQLPPYWALGFHLSRFGFKNTSEMMKVWNRTRAAGIPYDTQWADIDYMDRRNDFTVDPVNFKGLKEFVDQLHSVNMKFVPILDPGVSGSEPAGSYTPYDEGVHQGVFVMDGDKPYRGLAWNPKSTVFVDFSHPKALQYWTKMLTSLHKKLPFDGIWIDMNEPSNFNYNGSQCPSNTLNNPPYVPAVVGGLLSYQTVCMSAQHFAAHHYDMHNVYGMLEAVVTSLGVTEAVGGQRPFVLTRASFLTSPTYTAHWTGDVYSTWEDLVQSIRDIQSQALFGQGMVGADICGFNGNTTVALCSKWTAAGAFYPFSRNHNSDENIDQDPVALGADVINAAKVSLTMRYSLLPYLYTLLHQHHTSSVPVIRGMFVEFPQDDQTYSIEDQFMWGSALLFAPLLNQTGNSRSVYLGPGRWLDWHSGSMTEVGGKKGKFISVTPPSGGVPAFLRGGHIVPMQYPANTTAESRTNNFMLRAALDDKSEATGLLYWDDGYSLKMYKEYNMISLKITNNSLSTNPTTWWYPTNMTLDSVKIAPLPTVHNVTMNSGSNIVALPFHYDTNIKELHVTNFTAPLSSKLNITWTV